MIYEPQRLEYDTLWVDGFLPSNEKLSKILSAWQGHEFIGPPDDKAIMEAVELKANQEYADRFRSVTRPGGYLQMLRPLSLHNHDKKHNPIQNEYELMNSHKDKYRLMFLVSRDEILPNCLKDSFLNTIEELNFEYKSKDTYDQRVQFEQYLTYLSNFFIERYFIPAKLIKNNLESLGFNSKNSIII